MVLDARYLGLEIIPRAQKIDGEEERQQVDQKWGVKVVSLKSPIKKEGNGKTWEDEKSPSGYFSLSSICLQKKKG